MSHNILFYIVFFSQIVLISWVLPRKLQQRLRAVFSSHPPSTHPRLYPQPLHQYESALTRFAYFNLFALLAGLFFLVVLIRDATDDDWSGVVFGYFMLQYIPIMLMEVSSFKHFKQMRQADTRRVRTAKLRARRITDYISPALLAVAGIVYLAFVAFIVYVNQFEYPWFGGYTNIFIITAMNVVFGAVIAWNIYGKKKDPYQSDEDRHNQARSIARQVVFVSIAATLFVMLSVALSAFELRHLRQLAISLYFQIIAVVSYQAMLKIGDMNFDVYKEETQAT